MRRGRPVVRVAAAHHDHGVPHDVDGDGAEEVPRQLLSRTPGRAPTAPARSPLRPGRPTCHRLAHARIFLESGDQKVDLGRRPEGRGRQAELSLVSGPWALRGARRAGRRRTPPGRPHWQPASGRREGRARRTSMLVKS